MLLFLQKSINYGYVARYAYAYAYRYLFTFVAGWQLKQLPNLFELFVKQNSNTFLFHLKQFSEITIVREHKRV